MSPFLRVNMEGDALSAFFTERKERGFRAGATLRIIHFVRCNTVKANFHWRFSNVVGFLPLTLPAQLIKVFRFIFNAILNIFRINLINVLQYFYQKPCNRIKACTGCNLSVIDTSQEYTYIQNKLFLTNNTF